MKSELTLLIFCSEFQAQEIDIYPLLKTSEPFEENSGAAAPSEGEFIP